MKRKCNNANIQERSEKKWHLVEGAWPLGGKDLAADTGGETVGKRELEFWGEELLDVWALDIVGLLDHGDPEDVNRSESSTVTGCHVLVQGLNGSGSGKFPILLVHVVGAGARVISDPDTEILHLKRPLLNNLVK